MQSADPGQGTEAEAVVAAIADQVSYLRIELDPAADDGWIATSSLLADPSALLDLIRATGAGRAAPDDQVAASLWFQAYAFRAALPVIAPVALGLAGLSADPAVTSIRIARNRPAAIAVSSRELVHRTPVQAASALLGEHLAPVAEAVSSVVTVGQRLLWGNAAASCATVLRALEGAPGADRASIRRIADEVMAGATAWFDGLGWFDVVEESGVEGWYWTRTNCCLWDRCEGASRCDDCSLTSPADLDAARRAALQQAALEGAS